MRIIWCKSKADDVAPSDVQIYFHLFEQVSVGSIRRRARG